MACLVCGLPGAVTVKPLNGLPIGAVVCESCRQAVRDRQVGISRRADGSWSVTDGRPGPQGDGDPRPISEVTV